METQTQMHRMGLRPFLTFYIDTMLNLTVTLTQMQTQTSSVNRALIWILKFDLQVQKSILNIF